MRKSLVLLSVLALTGCAAQVPTPTITSVGAKYCAVSDAAGFNDDGLNRSVYAALQQLKVQTGASVVAVEVSDKLSAQAAFDKTAAAHCNAVIAAGNSLVNSAIAAAKLNTNIHYYSVSDSTSMGIATANYSALTFNIYQAAYEAGYLAAATANADTDVNRININNQIKTSQSLKLEKAFALGVDRFNAKNNKQVSVVISDVHSGEEIIFALAGYVNQLGVLAQSSATPPIKVVGFGRDWYSDVRNKAIRSSILTSVIRKDVIGKVAEAVVNKSGSAHYDLSNDGVGLVDANDISWPLTFPVEVSQMIKDFQSGKVKVG